MQTYSLCPLHCVWGSVHAEPFVNVGPVYLRTVGRREGWATCNISTLGVDVLSGSGQSVSTEPPGCPVIASEWR